MRAMALVKPLRLGCIGVGACVAVSLVRATSIDLDWACVAILLALIPVGWGMSWEKVAGALIVAIGIYVIAVKFQTDSSIERMGTGALDSGIAILTKEYHALPSTNP